MVEPGRRRPGHRPRLSHGQRRAVQVHKLVCAGTVEEKIDRLLEQKPGLASEIISADEQWITELDSRALRDLFALSEGAVADEDEPVAAMPVKPRAKSRLPRVEVQP